VFVFFQAEDGIRDRNVTGVQTLLFRSPKSSRPVARAADSCRSSLVPTNTRSASVEVMAVSAPQPAGESALPFGDALAPLLGVDEIGRASCRESVDGVGGDTAERDCITE